MAATLEFTAKENITEQLFKLEQQNLRLIEQNKTLARESGKATKEAKAGFEDLQSTIGGMIPSTTQLIGTLGGFTSIIGVVASLKNAFSDWRQEVENLGRKSKDFADAFVADMARSRDVADAPKISAALRGMTGLTPDEARQVFAGVTSANPSVDLDQRLALTREAAGAHMLLGDRFKEGGTLIGKVGQMVPGRSAEATVGMALKLQQLSGQHADQLTGDKFMRAVSTLSAAGVAPEDAMGKMIVALERGQGRPGALISAAEAVDKDWVAPKTSRSHRTLTDKEKQEKRFAEASKEERWKLLQTDKGMREAIMGDQAIMLQQIDPAKAAERAGAVRSAGAPGWAAGQEEMLKAGPEGVKSDIAHQEALRLREAQTRDRELGGSLNRAQSRFETSIADDPWYSRWGSRIKWQATQLLDPAARGLPTPGQPRGPAMADQWEQMQSEEGKYNAAERQVKALERIEKSNAEMARQGRSPNPTAVQAHVNNQE